MPILVLRGGTGGFSETPFTPSLFTPLTAAGDCAARRLAGGTYTPSSHTFSTMPVRMYAHIEHVVRRRARHQRVVQSGYIVGFACVLFCGESGSETGNPDDVAAMRKM